MPLSALLLVLAAACVHAAWNLLLSGARDTHAATAVAGVAGTLLFAPLVLVSPRIHTTAVPYIVTSSAAELLYMGLLAAAYSAASMGFVYPLARGSAPVLVLAVSALALHASVSAGAVAGVLLIALGVMLVRGISREGAGRETLLAFGVGGCIATYTLIDKHGVQHADPIAYIEAVFGITSLSYLAVVWRWRGGRVLRSELGWRQLLAGAGFSGSYLLVLLALRLTSAATVAAVRESSVLIATIALVITGRERWRPARLAGAAAVVAGIALISLT